jgi:hypothetical protein
MPVGWAAIDLGHPFGDFDFYLPPTTHQPAEVCNSSPDPDNTFAAE